MLILLNYVNTQPIFWKENKFLSINMGYKQAKPPIYNWLENTLNCDLFKLTKLYNDKNKRLKINTNIGLQLKLYPFYCSSSSETLNISPYCYYEFTYKKNVHKFTLKTWGNNIKRIDKSFFYGYSFGVSVGYY